MSMVSANVYDRLNMFITTNIDNKKESSESSSQNDQILELIQEVQNMGKALTAISERTNETTTNSVNQQSYSQPKIMNTDRNQTFKQNPRRNQQNRGQYTTAAQWQFINSNQRPHQFFDRRRQYIRN